MSEWEVQQCEGFCPCFSGEERGGRAQRQGRARAGDPQCRGDDDRPPGHPAQEQAHHSHGWVLASGRRRRNLLTMCKSTEKCCFPGRLTPSRLWC